MKIYEIYTSYVTIDEINDCTDKNLRDKLLTHLDKIDYNFIADSDNIRDFAEKIIRAEVLKPSSFDDCCHIAAAITAECDMIVSLNFKHIVNIKTVNGVRSLEVA